MQPSSRIRFFLLTATAAALLALAPATALAGPEGQVSESTDVESAPSEPVDAEVIDDAVDSPIVDQYDGNDPEVFPTCEDLGPDGCSEDDEETVAGGGETPVLGATPVEPVAGGGNNLPFTGLPLYFAWFIGIGLMLIGGLTHALGRRS